MRCGMDDGKEQHRIGELPVHPDVFVERDEPDLGPDKPHDGSADREQDEHPVHAQNQPSTSRHPHRILERIQARQTRVGRLLPPTHIVLATTSP